jgi:hypothetical protein
MIDDRDDVLSFPLYHGTSSHYTKSLSVGQVVPAWPYKSAALLLLREATDQMKRLGGVVEFWERDTLLQLSEHSNWQHGEIYVTPSLLTASKYAKTGGEHGGELLEMVWRAIERLAQLDATIANLLLAQAQTQMPFLKEVGRPKILQFNNVSVSQLRSEFEGNSVSETINHLKGFEIGSDLWQLVSQQMNFRLDAAASISAILDVED